MRRRAQPVLDRCELGQLLRSELATQSLDGLEQGFRPLATGHGIGADASRKLEGLRHLSGFSLERPLWPLRWFCYCDESVGEIAPRIELSGTDADLRFHFREPSGDRWMRQPSEWRTTLTIAW
jgi:hypothetical protein